MFAVVVMPIAYMFSLYWSYIHGNSESYMNGFLNWNEMGTEHRREITTI